MIDECHWFYRKNGRGVRLEYRAMLAERVDIITGTYWKGVGRSL
jgi:7-keto-8-aminopelargonate synthetase-like enzyme